MPKDDGMLSHKNVRFPYDTKPVTKEILLLANISMAMAMTSNHPPRMVVLVQQRIIFVKYM